MAGIDSMPAAAVVPAAGIWGTLAMVELLQAVVLTRASHSNTCTASKKSMSMQQHDGQRKHNP